MRQPQRAGDVIAESNEPSCAAVFSRLLVDLLLAASMDAGGESEASEHSEPRSKSECLRDDGSDAEPFCIGVESSSEENLMEEAGSECEDVWSEGISVAPSSEVLWSWGAPRIPIIAQPANLGGSGARGPPSPAGDRNAPRRGRGQ